jgi:hypothetical protein
MMALQDDPSIQAPEAQLKSGAKAARREGDNGEAPVKYTVSLTGRTCSAN